MTATDLAIDYARRLVQSEARGPDSLTATERLVNELWPDTSVSTADIARRAGVSQQTVYNTRRRLGLPDRSTYETPATVAVPEPVAVSDDAPVTTANGARHDLSGVAVSLEPDDETITWRNRTMDVTAREARIVATLLDALPEPVSVARVLDVVYADMDRPVAKRNLATALRGLGNGLKGIDIDLVTGGGGITLGVLHVDA